MCEPQPACIPQDAYPLLGGQHGNLLLLLRGEGAQQLLHVRLLLRLLGLLRLLRVLRLPRLLRLLCLLHLLRLPRLHGRHLALHRRGMRVLERGGACVDRESSCLASRCKLADMQQMPRQKIPGD